MKNVQYPKRNQKTDSIPVWLNNIVDSKIFPNKIADINEKSSMKTNISLFFLLNKSFKMWK